MSLSTIAWGSGSRHVEDPELALLVLALVVRGVLIAPSLDRLMVAQTGCSDTTRIARVRSLATMPVVAGVGDLRPDVHVRVHASDAVNVLLTLRGHLDNLQAELVEGLTNLSLLPMILFFGKWCFRINFWAFFKENMLLS